MTPRKLRSLALFARSQSSFQFRKSFTGPTFRTGPATQGPQAIVGLLPDMRVIHDQEAERSLTLPLILIMNIFLLSQ
jgi:hypothetical protein